MTIPTIHLNGSDGHALASANLAAYTALSIAIDCAREAAPHPRDFYVQGLDAFTRARDAHERAVAALRKAADHFRGLYDGVQAQLDERTRRRRSA